MAGMTPSPRFGPFRGLRWPRHRTHDEARTRVVCRMIAKRILLNFPPGIGVGFRARANGTKIGPQRWTCHGPKTSTTSACSTAAAYWSPPTSAPMS